MHRPIASAALGCIVFATSMFATGCATVRAQAVGAPDAATTAAFDRLKTLAGTWEAPDEKGVKSVVSIVTVSSNGSAIREVMLPGTPNEMTNMYHLDGSSIMVTHYCAMGNQPRMRCRSSDGTTFSFAFDGITNMAGKDDNPMASLIIEIKDANHISQTWDNLKPGADAHAVFELSRKR